jgi:hypothetical protein
VTQLHILSLLSLCLQDFKNQPAAAVSLTPDLSLSLISLPPTNPTSTMKGSVYL